VCGYGAADCYHAQEMGLLYLVVLVGWAREAAAASRWYNRLQHCRWFGGMELLLGNALTRNKQRILAQVRVA
jgi:hypothetical protein